MWKKGGPRIGMTTFAILVMMMIISQVMSNPELVVPIQTSPLTTTTFGINGIRIRTKQIGIHVL
jgi:hypothetical protein